MTIDDYLEDVPYRIPPEVVHPLTRHMLDRCPVVHSDDGGGFWLINRHEDVVRVLQDADTFVNGNTGVRVPGDAPGVNRPPMPPIDSNPPDHRRSREVLNPYFSPKALERHEEPFRTIIGRLMDVWAGDGHCDIANQLAKKFPSEITCQQFLGVTNPDDLHNLYLWNRKLSYEMWTEDPAVLADVQRQWSAFSQSLIDARRAEPGDDVVTGLVHAQFEGKPLLTDEEVIGAIQIIVSGGFSTTSEATSNIVVRLIDDPGLEAALRADPSLIPVAIEEIMRLEPPVSTRPRKCTRDTVVGGQLIRKDERLLVSYLGANVDPEQWDDPDEFRLDRKVNRSMTFSAGPHRCIGSNVARMSLRIMVEELLARVTNIQYADEQKERRVSNNAGAWRAVDSFPITFTPLVGH